MQVPSQTFIVDIFWNFNTGVQKNASAFYTILHELFPVAVESVRIYAYVKVGLPIIFIQAPLIYFLSSPGILW